MQKKIILLFMVLLLFILTGCENDTIEHDLQDGKCNVCGGNWHYSETTNLLNNTHYYYKCDRCKRELYTEQWFGDD